MTDPSQSVPPYHIAASLARTALTAAMEEAKAMLPPAVTRAHWQVKQHATAPWEAVETWYRLQPDYDAAVLDTLTDLQLMSNALANLFGVLTERTTTGTLKVAKTRRVEL